MSNYHVQMLPGLDEPDLYDVQGTRFTIMHSKRKACAYCWYDVELTLSDVGYYQAVLDMPYWDYKSVGNFIYAGIKIYCGSSAFVPHLGDWLDTTSGYMVVLRSRPGIPGTNICGERLGTTILGRMSIQDLRGKDLKRDVAILIMCDGSLIKVRGADVVRSDDNKLDAASFAMVKRKGMLNRHQAMMSWKVTDDSPTQTGLAHVWSVTLLHELFHYILDYESNCFPLLRLDRGRLTDSDGSVPYIQPTLGDLWLEGLLRDLEHRPGRIWI
jgi:hypothetical protein